MKRRNCYVGILFICCCILLSACRQQQIKKTNPAKAQPEISTESSTPESAVATPTDEHTASFTGIVSEPVSVDSAQSDVVIVKLKDVQAINDPQNILPSFTNDGVTLNAAKSQFRPEFVQDHYQEGTKITFELEEQPMMTMSIPPQILGRSIKQISLAES